LHRGLSFVVGLIDKYRHPLIASTVGIYCSPSLFSALNLDAVFASPHGILWITALNNQIWVSVEMTIFDESARVLRQASSQHV